MMADFPPSSLHPLLAEPFIAAGKTMEDLLAFHSSPGFYRHQGKYFAAVVTREYP